LEDHLDPEDPEDHWDWEDHSDLEDHREDRPDPWDVVDHQWAVEEWAVEVGEDRQEDRLWELEDCREDQ